jgi:hypothetical protein
MANTAIHFEWSKGWGYELSGEGKVIRQSHRGRDRFHPLEINKSLYVAFSRLDGTPNACLEFARSWGLLTERARPDAAEPLELWRQKIRLMKASIAMVDMVRTVNSRRSEAAMATVKVVLVSGEPDAKPILVLRPPTLWDAMLTQLALSKAGGGSLATCEQCGNPFEVGASGKRSVAKFCSDECRNRFNNQRRARKA